MSEKVEEWDGEWLYRKYHEEGLTTEEMADEADVNANTIRRQMRRLGIPTFKGPLRSMKYREKLRAHMEFRYSMGWTPEQFEVIYGVSVEMQRALTNDWGQGYL